MPASRRGQLLPSSKPATMRVFYSGTDTQSGWQGRPGDRLVSGIQRPCAPSARMKSPLSLLAHGQGLFFARVTLSEHKWVTSRERRGGEAVEGVSLGMGSYVRLR